MNAAQTDERLAVREGTDRQLLTVSHLAVGFPAGRGGSVVPVRDVSFKVRVGERVGLLGESGSGKSLTVLAVVGLLPAPGRIVAGEILLGGADLAVLSEQELTRVRGGRIAMVYQNPLSALNPLQTIGRQIVEALRCHQRVERAAARRAAASLLGDVGIRSPARAVDSYPHELSGGMRQRVMIAIALSTGPELLLADEPTTALDVTTQARILALLFALAEERGMAVVLVTHDLAIATSFCDHINVMYAGRIVEGAPADALRRRPAHPYSAALLNSICDAAADVARPLPSIMGTPPGSAHDFPGGCAFHPRCPVAVEVCSRAQPAPVAIGGDRVAECHLARAVASAGEPVLP